MVIQTKLSRFNNALFNNMAAFVDAVWVVDPYSEMVEIIHDRIYPDFKGRLLSLADVRQQFFPEEFPEKFRKERSGIMHSLEPGFLKKVTEQKDFSARVHVDPFSDEVHMLYYTMTPEFDEKNKLNCVYISFKSLAEKVEDINVSSAESVAEKEMRRYFYSLTCGIIQYTQKSKRIVYANDIALDLLGYENIEELQNDNFDGVSGTVNRDDAERINKSVDTLASEDEKVAYEYTVQHKTGKEVICYGTAQILIPKKGEPIVQRTLIDITASRMAAQKGEFLDLVNCIVNSGMWHFILDDEGNISRTFWSDTFRHKLGFDDEKDFPDELESWISRLHPEDKDEAVKRFWQGIRGEAEFDVKFRVQLKSGVYHWFAAHGKTGDYANGKPHLYLGTFMDINDELEMEAKETHHKALVEALSRDYLNVYLINTKTRTVHVQKLETKAMEKIGFISDGEYPYDDFVKTYASRRLDPDYAEEVLRDLNLENVIKSLERNPNFRYMFRTLDDGKVLNYQGQFVQLEGTDEIIIGIRNVDDVIEKQKRENSLLEDALAQARRANHAKTIFLSNMSHDIRTPMNAIIGYTDLALNYNEESEKVVDYLTKIKYASKHLLSLINDVLDMSRIESGKVTIEAEEESLLDIMNDIRTIVQNDALSKKLDFYIDDIDIRDDRVYCDRLRLKQILLNLISNAIKFTPEGGFVDVRVSQLASDKRDYACFQFRVSDTGIGMSADFVKKIFDPFERERTSTVSGIQGTGLGMAICKSIVDMMGGTISVKSKKGKGTIFTVNLSFKLADSSKRRNTLINVGESVCSDSGHAEPFWQEPLNVLLVEDNEFNREIAREIFSSMNMNVDTAENGKIAVDKVAESEAGTYDVIFMDVQMPVMDGYKASRAIRSIRNRAKSRIPIIAMTANAFEEDRSQAFDAGMNAHIAKPIDIEVVVATLRMILTTR